MEGKKRTEIAEIGKFGLIERICSRVEPQNASTVKGCGDDTAVTDAGDRYVLLSTELLLEGVHFDLIEPLDHFFKDEVRALGTALGLPDYIVHRQPFPGPGLAIRIIGDVDAEKLSILKNADAIVREELDAYNERLFAETGERNSEHAVWQYFAVLPDIKSVGVMGDERTYQRPVILRAVESSDAMTADWAKLPYEVLARISGRIVAEVPGVNRVAYDITSKPPATIEWE